MARRKTILTATDFSDASNASIAQAVRLAKASNATLHVLHATSSNSASELAAFFPNTTDFGLATVFETLREQVDRQIEANAPTDVDRSDIEIHVRAGNPFRVISAAIEEFEPDLLVIGSTGVSDHRLGTVGGKCVRKAHVDVLLVPAGFDASFKHITACIDFSELSPSIVQRAASIAEIDSAALNVLYAHESVDESVFVEGPPQELIDMLPGVIESRFQEQLAKYAGNTPHTFTMTTCSAYSQGIIHHANQSESDLVVTGTTGRSGLAYMLLGTTAEKVIRGVGCAVLAVKPHAH